MIENRRKGSFKKISSLQKKTMFLRELLCICVVLHFAPGFYKWVECTLVRKPKNVAVLSGEIAILNCASSVSKGNIVWSTVKSDNYIYINKNLVPSVSSYIYVSDEDDGNCSLNINASSLIAAKRYICIERDSGEEANAELIVLQNPVKCNPQVNNGSVLVSCSVVSAGKWAPVVTCDQVNENKGLIQLQGSQSNRSANDVVTNTWTFRSDNDSFDIICSTEFRPTERPTEIIASYCPLCNCKRIDIICDIEYDNKHSIHWSRTFAGTEIYQPCPGNTTGQCSRKCLLNSKGIAFWSETNWNGCFDQTFRDLLKKVNKFDATALINQNAVGEIVSQLSVLTNKSEGLSSGNLNASFMMINRLAPLRNNSIKNPSKTEINSFYQAISNVLQPNNFKALEKLENIDRTVTKTTLFSVSMVYGWSLSTLLEASTKEGYRPAESAYILLVVFTAISWIALILLAVIVVTVLCLSGEEGRFAILSVILFYVLGKKGMFERIRRLINILEETTKQTNPDSDSKEASIIQTTEQNNPDSDSKEASIIQMKAKIYLEAAQKKY